MPDETWASASGMTLMKKTSKKTKSSAKKSIGKVKDLKPRKNPKGGTVTQAYTAGGSTVGQRVVR